MATSMIRQLFTITVRRTPPFLRSLNVNYFNESTRLFRENIIKRCRFPIVTATGLGMGVSLGFLGINISKTGDDKKEEAEPEKKEEEVDKLTQLYRKARIAHAKQDLEEADNLYNEALKLAEEMHKNEEITDEKHVTAKTLFFDGMANIALVHNRIEQAEALFKEVLKGCLTQGMPEDNNVIIEISLKLASLYAMQKKKLEAEEGYKFCIAMLSPKMDELELKWLSQEAKNTSVTKEDIAGKPLETLVQDTAILLGMSVGSYGRFLMYEKRYPEALRFFERSKVFCKNTMGVDSNQYSVILNDLATLYILTQNFNEANGVLSEGITLTKKYNLPEIAVLHCNLGALHLRKGDYKTAEKNCQLAEMYADKYSQTLAKYNAQSCLKKVEEVLQKKAKEAQEKAKK